jgi:hypothetical protein
MPYICAYYHSLSTISCMNSMQSKPPFSKNCNKTLLNGELFVFTPGNMYCVTPHRMNARGYNWLTTPNFSQRNLKRLIFFRIWGFLANCNRTFILCGLHIPCFEVWKWKPRDGAISEEGDDDCINVMLDFVDNLS